jgi:RimJ/RimL family protein N-acetyltransferase
MVEAGCGLIQHLFTTLNVNAVYSGAFEGNKPSLLVHEKLGFVRDSVATLRRNSRQRDPLHTTAVLSRTTYETLKRSPHAIS